MTMKEALKHRMNRSVIPSGVTDGASAPENEDDKETPAYKKYREASEKVRRLSQDPTQLQALRKAKADEETALMVLMAGMEKSFNFINENSHLLNESALATFHGTIRSVAATFAPKDDDHQQPITKI